MKIQKGELQETHVKSRFAAGVRIAVNRLTRIPKRVVGIETFPSPLKKGAVPLTRDKIESTFKRFIRDNRKVFGVDTKELKLASAKMVNKRWYVTYGQFHQGIPVHNSIVSLESAESGLVHSFASNYLPDIDISISPQISCEQAVKIARDTYPQKVARGLIPRQEMLVIYPDEQDDQVTCHLAWKFLLSGDMPNPEMDKYFFIDAMDGNLLRSYTANFPGATVSGTVRGEIYPANPTDTISTMPIRHGRVEIIGAGTTTTSLSGGYTEHVPWWWDMVPLKQARFTLEGPYARVQNADGSDYIVTQGCDIDEPCDLTWSASDRDHINLFYHMNLFHDWLANELGYWWVNLDGTQKFCAQVNHTFSNAYAGNPMTFGTNNYARSSDVIYHECTHNILHHEYGDYIGWPDAYIEAYAMDEGFADYFACSFTNSPVQGEGCSASPRDLNNTRQYPGKSSYNIEGHTGGMIIAGAAWDFRQRLVSNHGMRGARIADQIILQAHQILSAYPRKYYFSDPHESNLLTALYKAADVDNNLHNGFPYFYDIQRSFHDHALLQAVLEDEDSYDFSTNTVGNVTGGDLYFYEGKFWANNLNQKGVVSLGDIGEADLAAVDIPSTGYTRFGVTAIAGHTYVSKAQEGETASFIVFRVLALPPDKSTATIRYFYRFHPRWYIANLNSKEIHKLDCHWVSLMANSNKTYCRNLEEAANLIREEGYNGCHYCLPRYDTDTRSLEQVHANLDADLAG